MTPSERQLIKVKRDRARRLGPVTRYVYRHVWPVTDDSMTLRELGEEALPDLRYAIAAAGAHPSGPPKWEIGTDETGAPVLVVTVPCVQTGRPAKEIDEETVAHLARDGASTAQIAAMLGAPLDLVELALLRCKHYSNSHPVEDDHTGREADLHDHLDDLGLGNDGRMWREPPGVVA